MPELPEVETVRQTLDRLLAGKKIEDIYVHYSKIIKRPDSVAFIKQLTGQTFRHVKRRGKFLVFSLDRDVLVSHLRMEGKFRIVETVEPIDKHTHIVFKLNTGEELRYHDVRKFGTMHIFKKGEETEHAPLNQLGPEPMDQEFTVDYLKEKLHRTQRTIKQALLDQTLVAGIGNIYADEILHRASVHPLKKSSDLTEEEIENIHCQSAMVLNESISLGGSTIRTYLNSQGKIGQYQTQLLVYGHQGEPCQSCGSEIVKIQSHGRGTHFCPNCQRKDDCQ